MYGSDVDPSDTQSSQECSTPFKKRTCTHFCSSSESRKANGKPIPCQKDNGTVKNEQDFCCRFAAIL